MFALNLKIAFRNLWKHRGYAIFNIIGLAISLTCVLIIFLFIHQWLSADNFHPKANRTYRVVSIGNNKGVRNPMMGVPAPMANALKAEFPQLEKVANIAQSFQVVDVPESNGTIKQHFREYGSLFYTDPAFFEILNFPWLIGSPSSLNAPLHMALTQSTAVKYFGNWQNAMGKKLKLAGDDRLYEVTGIMKDIPSNSDFPIHVAVSFQNYYNATSTRWNSVDQGHHCYVLAKPGTDMASLQQQLSTFTKKYYDPKDPLSNTHEFQSFATIHTDDNYGTFSGKHYTNGQLNALKIIGAFLLLIACINFINMATAQAVSRSKEVGVRKVLGSTRKQLMVRFLGETFIITLIAIIIACILTETCLPIVGNFLDQQISFNIQQYPVLLVFIFTLWVCISFLAGTYPALIISGYNPISALKSKIRAQKVDAFSLRNILVVLQFSVTLVLIIATLIVVKQINFFKNKPLGFNDRAIVQLNVPSDSLSKLRFASFKQKLMANSGIEMVSYAYTAPSTSSNNFTSFYLNNSSEKGDFLVCNKPADEDYFKLFGLRLLAGKPLSKTDTTTGYILNETMLHQLNFKKPDEAIGKMLKLNKRANAPIIGVVQNFNNLSLHGEITPVVLYTSKDEYQTLFVKLAPSHMQATLKAIANDFSSFFPNQFYEQPSFYDQYIANYYLVEEKTATLLSTFTGIAIFISCFGLFSLISFVAVQRTKEMAIRKVLGATTVELVKQLNHSFVKMMLIANLIAWPLSYILLTKWLQTFAYKIDFPWQPFIWAGLSSVLILVVTVSFRAYKTAVSNPINALKYE